MSGIEEFGIFCNVSVGREYHPVLILFGICGTVSTLVCLISVALLVFFRMWKDRTNRIMLSFSFAVSLLSISIMIQLIGLQVNYWKGERYYLCTFKSIVGQYAIWVMLLWTLLITIHLAIEHLYMYNREDDQEYNCKCLSRSCTEVFYHIFPWVISIPIALIPLATDSYGVSGPWCWIKVFNDDCSLNIASVVQVYVLWYAELVAATIFNTIGLILIVVVLCKRSFQEQRNKNRYHTIIKKTLPLIGFSITFQFFSFIALANRVTQTVVGGRYVQWTFYLHAVAAPAWGFFGGLFIIIYVIATGIFRKKNIKKALENWKLMKSVEKEMEVNACNNKMDEEHAMDGEHEHPIAMDGERKQAMDGEHEHAMDGEHKHPIAMDGEREQALNGEHEHAMDGEHEHAIAEHEHAMDGEHEYATDEECENTSI